jgi:hypothetical protein
MPQPTFGLTAAGRAIARFGNRPQPNGQGTLSYVDLNDLNTWHLQDDFAASLVQDLSVGQAVWRGRGVILGADFPPVVASLPVEYREASGPLGSALAPIVTAGEQWLTFDLVTGILARYQADANRRTVIRFGVRRWAFELEFLCREPFFRDLSSTTVAPTALLSGSATNFNVTYAGSIWAEPVWTLTIPNTNTAPIASFQLQNVMSGETALVMFPGNLAASTAWTVTIDSGALTILDQNGVAYDNLGGAFPMLYQPAGQVQQFSATLTPASGTATNCTIGASYVNRWTI